MACNPCNYGLSNTGQGNCQHIAKVTKKSIFREYFTNAGTVNGIDITSIPTLNKASWDTLKASLTGTKIYPTPNIAQNVNEERADSTFETFDSGQMEFVQRGAKKFSCIFNNATVKLLDFLEGMRCKEMGVYHVDIESNLVGNINVPTMFAPLRMDSSTIDVKWVPGTDKTGAKVFFSFQYAMSEKDQDLAVIPYTPTSVTGLTYDLLTIEGLIDASGTPGTISTSGYVVDLSYFSGDALNRGPVKGLVAANVALTNKATGATIALTSITESTTIPGRYTLVYAVQASAVSVRFRQSTTNYAWDFSTVGDALIP